MKAVIITGMPGAGKSEIAAAFSSAGFPVITMGDVIREETLKRGLEPNPQNTGTVMLELRAIDGPGAVAKRCIERLRLDQHPTVVIEGCRSIAEIEVFEEFCENIRIVCVHASPRTRYERLRNRGRCDAPLDWVSFRERDLREISVGLGGVIALSDYMIINEGTIDELFEKVQQIVKELS